MSLLNQPYSSDSAAVSPVQPVERPSILPEAGNYLPDRETAHAVNLALHLGVPLLVTGEPGVGKTRLADSVCRQLGWGSPLRYQVKSDSEARDVLYHFDALGRLYDAQRHDPRAVDPSNYVRYQALGMAIRKAMLDNEPSVLLIDEIDKAPNDFPNGLLLELEEYCFSVTETGEAFSLEPHNPRPLVIITSNSARALPDPFLRRCLVHDIPFPEKERLAAIVAERIGVNLDDAVLEKALTRFWELRNQDLGLKKKPSTADLLMWLRALAVSRVRPAELDEALGRLPGLQALLKQRDDIMRLRG